MEGGCGRSSCCTSLRFACFSLLASHTTEQQCQESATCNVSDTPAVHHVQLPLQELETRATVRRPLSRFLCLCRCASAGCARAGCASAGCASACLGHACVGRACVGSACVGSACAAEEGLRRGWGGRCTAAASTPGARCSCTCSNNAANTFSAAASTPGSPVTGIMEPSSEAADAECVRPRACGTSSRPEVRSQVEARGALVAAHPELRQLFSHRVRPRFSHMSFAWCLELLVARRWLRRSQQGQARTSTINLQSICNQSAINMKRGVQQGLAGTSAINMHSVCTQSEARRIAGQGRDAVPPPAALATQRTRSCSGWYGWGRTVLGPRAREEPVSHFCRMRPMPLPTSAL